MKEMIINFSEFIRIRICIFICAIGMSGYLLFNPLNTNLIFVALTSFFGAAGTYAYNNLIDKKEDKINRRRVSSFVLNNKAFLIIFICFLFGIGFSLFLSLYSIIFSFLGVIIGISYSFFKLKKYFLIKNLYTGLGANSVFLVGAANINVEVVLYYLLVSFFILIISMISDLRDYKGDKISHIKTLPVSLGCYIAKKFIFLLLGIFSLLILLYFINLFILLPFIFFMFYFLYKNKPSLAHFFGGFSFIFLIFWLMTR